MSAESKNASPPQSLPADFMDCWQRLPNKGFFLATLIAWLCLFQFMGSSTLGYVHSPSLYQWTFNVYDNKTAGTGTNDDAVGYLIPLVVLGLMWWKRKELLAAPLKLWPPAIGLVVLALFLHFAGYLVEQPRVSIVAFFVGIYGLTGLAWGTAWLRRSFFPFVLFAFCVPVSEQLLPVTFPLRLLSSWLTAVVANLLTIPVVRVGTQLMSPDGSFQYDVAAACSGIRSLVAIFLLAVIYGFVMFRAPGKRILLMALALPLSVLGNFLRLMCIILAAEFGGQSAGNYVHESSLFSLVPYVPVILGLIFIGRWLDKKPAKKTEASNPQPETTIP
jgi:exosortase